MKSKLRIQFYHPDTGKLTIGNCDKDKYDNAKRGTRIKVHYDKGIIELYKSEITEIWNE